MGLEDIQEWKASQESVEEESLAVEKLTGQDGKFYSLDHGAVILSVTGSAAGQFTVTLLGQRGRPLYGRGEEINIRPVTDAEKAELSKSKGSIH